MSLLIQREFLAEAEKISLDSEVDMFSVISTDRRLLERLTLRLQVVLDDEIILSALLDGFH